MAEDKTKDEGGNSDQAPQGDDQSKVQEPKPPATTARAKRTGTKRKPKPETGETSEPSAVAIMTDRTDVPDEPGSESGDAAAQEDASPAWPTNDAAPKPTGGAEPSMERDKTEAREVSAAGADSASEPMTVEAEPKSASDKQDDMTTPTVAKEASEAEADKPQPPEAEVASSVGDNEHAGAAEPKRSIDPTAVAAVRRPGSPDDGIRPQGPTRPTGEVGGSWRDRERFGWIVAAGLALVLVVGAIVMSSSRDGKVSQLEAEITERDGRISDLRTKLAAEQQAIEEYPNAVEALEVVKAEREKVDADLAAARTTLNGTAARLATQTKELTELQGQRAVLETETDTAQKELTNLRTTQETLNQSLAEKQKEQTVLQQTIGDMSEKLSSLQDEHGRLSGVTDATQKDLQEAMDLLETARGRMSR